MAFPWFYVAAALCAGVFSVAVTLAEQNNAMPSLYCALGVCVVAVVAFIWRDISLKLKGNNRTFTSLVGQYLGLKCVHWMGEQQRHKLDADTLRVKRVQEETLLQRLRKHANTCYGQQYGFSSMHGSRDFKSHHPITTHEHYQELISCIAAGEENTLVAQKPLSLAVTSGTSGPGAMLLRTKDTDSDFIKQGLAVCWDAVRKAFPATDSLQLSTAFVYSPTFGQSESGIPIGSYFIPLFFLRRWTTTPACKVTNENDALYLHLLFALKDPSVGTLESKFASTMFHAFTLLQDHWQELVDDIKQGKVSSTLALDPTVRARLEALMEPDPARAAQLRAHFQDGFRGIAKRLWPQLNLVLTVDAGSNQIYGDMLRNNYCQRVPFYSPFYAASKGLIGLNLWPLESNSRYLLCPRSVFCEFIPESSLEEEQPDTLLMDEVAKGQNYELVVTNASGLFRYRVGDVVKVVGFYNQCPIVRLQYRRGQMLNVRGEKVSEALFLGALKKAVAQWLPAQLVDYCCAESGIMGDSTGGSDPHYQVFVELNGVRDLTEKQRYKLDICLQEDSPVYKSFRIKGSIGPMRVQLVAHGTFRELHKQMTTFFNTSPNTFQMHRVLRRKEFAHFLLGKTIS